MDLMKNRLAFFLCFLGYFAAYSQKITGIVKDDATQEPIEGATVMIKDANIGTYTDEKGKFELDYKGTFPCTLVVSYVGLQKQEIELKNANKPLTIAMKSDESLTQPAVEIIDTRITEKQKENPLTVETMDIVAIKETPAANFYDGLGSLKGVDVTASSMGFKIINTRGFNTTRPVRSLQMIDGMDNQAPGLNFSLGNFVGASELDVQSVDLVVGASSALYGPNAFNGVIDMKLKSPFHHEGLSVMLKGGERYLFDGALRYAKAFKNAAGEPVFGFKINLAYMRADDWRAVNYQPTEQSQNGFQDIRGYDAVNIYGDERAFGDNGVYSRRNSTGLGIVYRTGYREEDLLNYDVRSLKSSIGLHYKITKDIELSTLSNYGGGTTIFQGDNRYSLKNLRFMQNKMELKGKDWFVRAYATHENAGNSFDAVFTALLLQRKAKPDDRWYADYSEYWSQQVMPKIRALPNYTNYYNESFTLSPSDPLFNQKMDSLLRLMEGVIPPDSMQKWHQAARAYADGPGNPFFSQVYGFKSRLEPGTPEFKAAYDSILNTSNFNDGGSLLVDRSALYHVQAEKKFTTDWLDFIVGASYRLYTPNSDGSIFSDTLVDRNDPSKGKVNINVHEIGSYVWAEKKFLADRLKINAALRMDKSKNFNYVFSPAASAVYSVKKKHHYRLSFSSAIRNPTLQDQYLYYNFGRALLIGNINGVDTLISYESLLKFLSTNRVEDTDTLKIKPVRPEKVRSIEIGYKGNLFKNVFVDASAYVSWYRDFLGFRFMAQYNPTTGVPLKVYRISANSDEIVRSQGFSIGITYFFKKYYTLSGNYSYNELNKLGATDPIIPAFNTPKHKFNVGFGFRDLVADIRLGSKTLKLRNWGFNANVKWQDTFFYEGSPQFTGTVPSFTWVDAQLNYKIIKWKLTFKLGASNLLNQQRYLAYGSPYIGRMAYFQALLEL